MYHGTQTNNWSPNIYKTECPVDWMAERNKTSSHGYTCGSKRTEPKAKPQKQNKA